MSPSPAWHRGFWLVTLAAIGVVAIGLSLGRWQLDRAAQKEALAAQIADRQRQPALQASELVATGEPAALWHRPVELRGEWLASHTLWLDNRQMNGRVGFFVVTPLRLDGGAVVLVQRGWAPRDFQDRGRVPRLNTPSGRVVVAGRVAPPPARLYELGEGGQGPIRQNIDLAALAQETGLPLLPWTVLQTGAADDGLGRDWPAPAVDVHKHYGYAFQWFGLSALFAFLYVWFQFIAPRRQRARP